MVQRELLERSGIVSWMVDRLEDPRRPEFVTYPLADLLRTVLVLLGQGWRDQDDADVLRHDPAFRLASSGRRGTVALDEGCHLPSQPTLSRLLDLLSSEANRRVLREAVLVVLERPDQLLLDRFWLITSAAETAMSAEDLLTHYRQRGSAENAFGELMDVLDPALSSAARAKTHYRGRKLPSLPSETDAFARNEALLLLNLMAYGIMHAGRRCMETATRTGWSLRRYRERVLKAGGRILIHARRATMVVADSAARFWRLIWPAMDRLAWPPP